MRLQNAKIVCHDFTALKHLVPPLRIIRRAVRILHFWSLVSLLGALTLHEFLEFYKDKGNRFYLGVGASQGIFLSPAEYS